MNILLDTHAFLWWITDDAQLSATARKLMKDSDNMLYWSAASSWEVAIKYALGRLPLPDEPEQFLAQELAENQIESLPTHIERVDIIFYELNHLKKQAFVTIPFIPTS